MNRIPDGSVDMILCDLPYGTTQNKWDCIISLEALWMQYRRIAKRDSAIVLNGSQPFTSQLVVSNLAMFRHEWVWLKHRGSNFANTVREPMKEHESILVFSSGRWTYNKQLQPRHDADKRIRAGDVYRTSSPTSNYGRFNSEYQRAPLAEMRVPASWQKFNTETGMHPTQKPVALFEYLIRTYTHEGETVLDNCMGSGTTAIACMNTGRKYIGFEQDKKYFQIAQRRIAEHHQATLKLAAAA